jgi:hypothetical protein
MNDAPGNRLPNRSLGGAAIRRAGENPRFSSKARSFAILGWQRLRPHYLLFLDKNFFAATATKAQNRWTGFLSKLHNQ